MNWAGIWAAIAEWAARADWLAIGTIVLALATSALAFVTWRGVRENKKLIEATQRSADIAWASAIPHLLPEEVQQLMGTGMEDMKGRLKISYAAGTVPARAIKVWVGAEGRVWIGRDHLMSATENRVKVLDLVQSRAGSEPPLDWNDWLRRKQESVTYRVVMRWSGPADNVTERAWWFTWGRWDEVPPSLRG